GSAETFHLAALLAQPQCLLGQRKLIEKSGGSCLLKHGAPTFRLRQMSQTLHVLQVLAFSLQLHSQIRTRTQPRTRANTQAHHLHACVAAAAWVRVACVSWVVARVVWAGIWGRSCGCTCACARACACACACAWGCGCSRSCK